MPRWLVLLVLVVAAACSRASDEGEKKTWADHPPPQDQPPPADLNIAYTVDGAAGGAITAATLAAKKPDFEDAERAAWLITSLIPASAASSTIEATSPAGVTVKFERPNAAGVEPVLFLTRRGEVIVSALDPKDPFPRYHGQGGRLHRAGDPWPRVAPVAKLAVTHKP